VNSRQPVICGVGHPREVIMIQPIHEIFYIDRLEHHTNSIVNKIGEFNLKQNVLVKNAQNRSNDYQAAVDDALVILLEIMNHAASLSRYFWPVSNREPHRGRGQRLRDVYTIDGHSPLKNRNVRNAVEHFDERLDNLLSEFPTSNILPSYFGSRANFDTQSAICFIGYLVDDQVIKILDTETKIPEVLSEIEKIQATLKIQVSNGHKF